MEVQEGHWENNPVESDTEDEEIVEERDEIPLRIRIQMLGVEIYLQQRQIRSRDVYVNPPHMADLKIGV